MTKEQLERAENIQSEIQRLTLHLEMWADLTDGNSLKGGPGPGYYLIGVPQEAFYTFKTACVAELMRRIAELEAEFERL